MFGPKPIPTGQILPRTQIGQWLNMVAAKSLTVVESGSFCGLGSTYCLASGLPHEGQMWTFEIDESRFRVVEALYHLAPQINTVLGKMHVNKGMFPEQVDFMLLDSGNAEEGRLECEIALQRAKIVALDDIDGEKHRENYGMFRDWETLIEIKGPFPDRANGFFAARNPKYENPLK